VKEARIEDLVSDVRVDDLREGIEENEEAGGPDTME